GRPAAVDLGDGAGGRGTGALAGRSPACGSDADGGPAARLQNGPLADARGADPAPDPALRVPRPNGPESAAADDPLAPGHPPPDRRPGGREPRFATPGRDDRAAAALRHRLLVAVLARGRRGDTRLPQVRGAPPDHALEANGRSDAHALRAALLRRSP